MGGRNTPAALQEHNILASATLSALVILPTQRFVFTILTLFGVCTVLSLVSSMFNSFDGVCHYLQGGFYRVQPKDLVHLSPIETRSADHNCYLGVPQAQAMRRHKSLHHVLSRHVLPCFVSVKEMLKLHFLRDKMAVF